MSPRAPDHPTGPAPPPGTPVWRPIRRFLGYGVLVGFALVFLYPFVLSAVTVFKTLPDIAAHPVTRGRSRRLDPEAARAGPGSVSCRAGC